MTPRATLVLGPSRAGKTRSLLNRYSTLLDVAGRGRCVWLAPNSTAVAEVRDALAVGSRLEPGVGTFAGFAQQLLVAGRVPARALAPGESRRLLEHAIAELRAAGQLRHFARVAETPGFVAQAGVFIADAKRRDAWAEALQKSARQQRERELAAIYGAYQRLLAKARAFDAEGLFWAARDAVKRAPELLAGIDLVVVDGFNDFTAAQYDILQRLAAAARETCISLTIDAATVDATAAARPDLFGRSAETLRTLGERMRCQRQWLDPHEEAATAPPMWRQVADKLFAAELTEGVAGDDQREPPAKYAPVSRPGGSAALRPQPPLTPHPPGAEIIAAPSLQREFEEVARRVKQLLAEGVATADVVVAFRNSAEHADRLRAVFADYGVPAWIDARPPLASAAVVRSLLNLLRLHAEDWPYRRLLAIATDRQIAWGGAGGELTDDHRRSAVEHTIRAAQIAAGAKDLLEHVAARVERIELAAGEDDTTADDATGRAAQLALPQLEWLRDSLGKLPRRAPLADWIAALDQLAATTGLLAAETQGPWGALAAALEAAIRADHWADRTGSMLDLGEFVAEVASVAAQATAPGGGDATGRVRVLAAERARYLRPRHLFVAALSEQSFPAPVREDRQRAEDRLREWLAGEAESLAEETAAETPAAAEMLLFYQLVNRPTDSLTLSYPALDAKAQQMPPSPYLAELERCCGAIVRRTEIPLGAAAAEHPERGGEPASASELRRFAVAGALDESPALLAALLAAPATAEVAQAVAAGLECVGSRAVRDGFGAWEGVLGSDAAQAEFARRFGSEHLWSPSQLESYALCPFKFFGEQVLGLRPAPELVLESDFGRRGVMLHETLAALHRQRAAERDETQTVADTPEQLAALRDELVAEYRQALAALAGRAPRTGLDAALWEIERRQIDSWAEQLSDQELSYRGYYADWDVPPEPRYFEARFGPGSRRSESAADAELTTDEPYRLQLAQEQLRLTGQIDRIDVGRVAGRTAFNVIDYKTSAKAAVKPDQVADGRQLQLPLYAMAAQELLLAAQDAVAWSAGYWSVQGKGLGKPGNKSGPLQVSARGDSELVTDAAWGATQDRLRERVAEIVAGIRRAEFPVFSADEHCTSYCPLRTTCRIAHVRSLQKTWHGAAMAEGEENGE